MHVTPNPGPPYKSVSQVWPNLFVGAVPPTGQVLQTHRFKLLVLAADEIGRDLPSNQFPGVEVLYAHLQDDGSEKPEDILRRACPIAMRVASVLRRGQRVLVTCHWGYNRSAVIAGLALVQLGQEPRAALALLRQKRPAAEGFRALGSREYEQALLRGCVTRVREDVGNPLGRGRP